MTKIDALFAQKETREPGQKPLNRRVLTRRVSVNPGFMPPVVLDRCSLSASQLVAFVEDYINDSTIARHSARSLENKRERLGKLIWFVRDREYASVGEREIKQFFVYMNTAPVPGVGRWNNPHCLGPLSAETVKTYFSCIRAFFRWCVAENRLETSPLDKTKPPISRPDQVQPFNEEQVKTLIAGAGRTCYAVRDTALLLVLLDTGMRVSEICALTHADLNLNQGEIVIQSGKGGKRRVVPISRHTRGALHSLQGELKNYLPTDAVFVSERGRDVGAALGHVGVQRVIRRIAVAAGVAGVRCSPHTFRHTFAVMFLRRGGNVFTLKQILGHESLAMTNRYVAVAQADIAAQHREFSPVEGLRLAKKKR